MNLDSEINAGKGKIASAQMADQNALAQVS